MKNNDRPLILITNDDGIMSPGLLSLAEAVLPLGEVLVAAPHVQQTGMGRAYPRTEDVGVIEERELELGGEKIIGYAVHGSPALCVAYGVLELADRCPDICISGINYGENMGQIATCSGTIGAALEAASHKIPSIAVSLQVPPEQYYENDYGKTDWSAAANMAKRWAQWLLSGGMPEGADLISINVPAKPHNADEYRITTQSNKSYITFLPPEKGRDRSKSCVLPLRPYSGLELEDRDSDIFCVFNDRVISVTPLSMKMSVPLSTDRQLP